MANRDEVAGFLRDYLKGRLEKAGLTEVTDATSLTGSGLIDSFGMLDLVTAAEERFQIQIDMDSVDFDKFTTFGGFVETVSSAPGS